MQHRVHLNLCRQKAYDFRSSRLTALVAVLNGPSQIDELRKGKEHQTGRFYYGVADDLLSYFEFLRVVL